MSITPTKHRARTQHRCDDHAAPWCPGWIEPGQTYTRHALPPGTDLVNEGPHWWVIRACQDCEEWRVDPIGRDYSLRQPGQVMP